ncbi:MAG: GNAT family N-acetyltransferase [Verrucomicrobia bacterium]|nr:GNAT family N-acetyltransferase [Verrucomicrobiota bacterium]MBS0636522.1 GNAT family N-acetyltransferase [Verrucomicrobiota bacterium]
MVVNTPETYWKLLDRPLKEISGCKTVYTGIPSPWLNGVIGGVAEEMDQVLRYFYEKDVPFTWWQLESAKNAPALEHFGKSDGMELKLSTLEKPLKRELQVECVSDERALIEFVRTLMQAYEAPDELFDPIFELFSNAGFEMPRLHFIGRMEGEAVSVCSLYIDEDQVASLFNVGTPEPKRKKGYATQLVHEALYYAKEHGLKSSALTSFPDAANIYKRLGYTTSVKFDIFIKK